MCRLHIEMVGVARARCGRREREGNEAFLGMLPWKKEEIAV
jgi:hypothetical protein